MSAVGTSAGTVAETVVHRPPAHLRGSVERCVGYRLEGFPAGEHRGLPSRHLTVVLPFDEPLRVSWPADPSGGVGSFETSIGGLHRTPAVIHHDGDQHGIQLDLTPAGARTLFGIPASALASLDVSLTEVWPGAGPLRDRLERCSSWGERFELLDRTLSLLADARVHRAPPMRPETAAAWQLMTSSDGCIAVADLADEVGWSRRHLTGQFLAEFGLGPKVTARIMRFERSRALLVTRSAGATVAGVAATCGYADQAHLARDWSELAGASPTAWLAGEALPIVPDHGSPGS